MKPYYDEEGITIYCGDSKEVLPEIGSVDLILTDPPYAAAAATVTTGFARAKWGGNWGDMSLVCMMADMVLDAKCSAGVSQVYWFCDHLSYAALVPTFFRRFPLIQNIVWDKDMLGVGAHYRKQTELIIYARESHAPAMRNDARDLIRLRPNYASKEHPAAKPLELITELMKATEFSCALDPFMGSGTTLRAAKDLGRKAIGIEIEERYCEIAAKRLAQGVLPL
jgi:site-specific DNA-methyltransferase (adenine-specific)